MGELAKSELAKLAEIANEKHQEGLKHAIQALTCFKECGAALNKAKGGLPHGQFKAWLEKNFIGSHRTAQQYMRIAREWKSRLAGPVNAGAITSLRDATELLTGPEPELRKPIKGSKGKKAAVLRALNTVAPGLAGRGIDGSDYFRFEGEKLRTWNGEVVCEVFSPLNINGQVHCSLLAILQEISDEKLLLDASDGELIVKTKGGAKTATFKIEPISVSIDGFEPPQDWTKIPEPNALVEAIRLATPCTGRDYANEALTCLYVAPDYVEAFDGESKYFRYSVCTGVAEHLLVPAHAIGHLTKEGFTPNEVSIAGDWIHFREQRDDDSYSIRCVTVKNLKDNQQQLFPDCSHLAELDGEPLQIPKKRFKDAIKRAAILAKQNAIYPDDLTLKLKPNKLYVKASSPTGNYSERLKIKYDGQPMQFQLSAKTLLEAAKRTNEFRIHPTALIVDAEPFKFVVPVHTPPETTGKRRKSTSAKPSNRT